MQTFYGGHILGIGSGGLVTSKLCAHQFSCCSFHVVYTPLSELILKTTKNSPYLVLAKTDWVFSIDNQSNFTQEAVLLATVGQLKAPTVRNFHKSFANGGSFNYPLHVNRGTFARSFVRVSSVASDGTLVDSGDLKKLCDEEQLDKAIRSTDLLEQQGTHISTDLIYSLLQLCGKKKDLTASRRVYSLIDRRGLTSITFWADHLIRLFASCGSSLEANQVFSTVSNPSVYTWNAIISANAKLGDIKRALYLYHGMQHEDVKPDKYTFLGILKACGSGGPLEQGRLIHDQIIRSGLQSDIVIGNSIVNMYAKCGKLEEGLKVFEKLIHRDVVTWGSMIAGYVQHGNGVIALELYKKMRQDGIEPDIILLSCVLKGCVSIGDIQVGRLTHDDIIKSGYEVDVVVGNTLVDLYIKCGCLAEGRKVFDELSNRDTVSWNEIIAGYVEHENCAPALDLFKKMQMDGVKPDKITFSCILKACGNLGAAKQGRLIHSQIIKVGLKSDAILGITLVGMYANCGNFEEARRVLNQLSNQSVEPWNALIAAYAQHGNCMLANECLEDMQQQGLKPDFRTYSSILAACSHAGQVEKGRQHFRTMIEIYGIVPDIEHFNCMIDLLGRAGHLQEAEQLLQTAPIPPSISGWRSLLTSCRVHGNMKLGRECYNQAVELDPDSATGYVLMSNLYADAQKWKALHKLQELKKCAGVVKKPGAAWIELENRVHEFIVGERIHSQCAKIYAELERLRRQMKELGYVPQVDAVFELMV